MYLEASPTAVKMEQLPQELGVLKEPQTFAALPRLPRFQSRVCLHLSGSDFLDLAQLIAAARHNHRLHANLGKNTYAHLGGRFFWRMPVRLARDDEVVLISRLKPAEVEASFCQTSGYIIPKKWA